MTAHDDRQPGGGRGASLPGRLVYLITLLQSGLKEYIAGERHNAVSVEALGARSDLNAGESGAPKEPIGRRIGAISRQTGRPWARAKHGREQARAVIDPEGLFVFLNYMLPSRIR